MARGQVRLEGVAQFVILAEVLDLCLPVLLHLDGLDHGITELLNLQRGADSSWTTLAEVENRVNTPRHMSIEDNFVAGLSTLLRLTEGQRKAN